MKINSNIVSRRGDIFSLFKQAIKGTEQNYTTGSIDKAIFLLAVPMVLETLMESLFSVVDIFVVSHLGTNAVATVGLTESMLTIVYSIAIGVSMAATAMVSRRTGEKNTDAAAKAGIQAIYIGIGLSVFITIIGLLFSKQLLQLMGGSPRLIAEGFRYTQLMMTGNLVILLLFLINGVFRGAGDASIAMKSLWLANGINIILSPLLVLGWGPFPSLGLTGAAIGTTIGRGSGVMYQIYHLYKGKGVIKIKKYHLPFNWPIIKEQLKLATGGTLQFIIASASWIFLARIVATFGDKAMAGYTISIRILIFAILPAWGMANAAATLVGQNLGAKEPLRAEQSVWRAGMLNMIFLTSIGTIFWIFAPHIISIVTDDIIAKQYAVQSLRIVALGYVFYAYGMVIPAAFNGAGDTKTPTFINIFGFWCFQIPLAWWLAVHLNMGPKGVFIAIAIAESMIAIVGIILFKRGKWKEVKV